MTNPDVSEPLTGTEFLKKVWILEDECTLATDSFIADMGVRLSTRFEGIGTVLYHLCRMGSCYWGCSGEHTITYLCCLVSSNGHAAVRLLRMGYYDESLLLIRSIGEVANLLELFAKDSNALAKWRQARESQESVRKEFSPFEVRKRLEELTGDPPPVDKKRYSLLSERSVHAYPNMAPQSFNLLDAPTNGLVPQQIGLTVCLNELARSLAKACDAAIALFDFDDHKIKESIKASSDALSNEVGRLDLGGNEEMRSLITVVVQDKDVLE